MLDFKEFRKVKDEKDHAVLKHPKGHEIKIAKKALSGKLRKQLDSLPHYAEGTYLPIGESGEQAAQIGTAESNPSGPEAGAQAMYSSPTPTTLAAAHNVFQQFGQLSPEERNQLVGSPDQGANAPIPPSQSGLGTDPYGYQEAYKTLQRGAGTAEKGFKAEGALSREAGEASYVAAENERSSQQEALDKFINQSADIDQESQDFMHDVANQHIDPTKYLGDMSTTGKISTAIGLILGGIGGGLMHQENPALKFINAQIDRDIKAQESNLDSKKTLLRANLERYQNKTQAFSVTRAMMNDLAALELKAQAAKYGGQIDQAKMQQALGQFQINKAQSLQQAKLQAFMTSGAQANNELPDAIDPNLSSSFRLNGIKHYAADPEAAKKARDESASLEGLSQSVKDINAFNNRHGSTLNPLSESYGEAQGLNSVAASKLAAIESMGGAGIGRLISHFKEGMPVAGAFAQGRQKGASRAMDTLIREGHNTIVNSYGTRGPNLFLPPKGKR